MTPAADRPIKSQLYQMAWQAVDWLFPPVCGGCGTFGERWCSSCQNQTVPFDDSICPYCGYPSRGGKVCPACRSKKPPFQVLRSWAPYTGPLRKSLHRIKYQQDLGLAEVFALPLADIVSRSQWRLDLVTTIPLGRQRQKERGYNQSDWFARPLAYRLGLPLNSKAVSRVRETRSQVGLSSRERWTNVEDAFQANTKIVKNKTVLLFDDITTTGATIQHATTALLDAGATKVYCLTLARAVLQDDMEN